MLISNELIICSMNNQGLLVNVTNLSRQVSTETSRPVFAPVIEKQLNSVKRGKKERMKNFKKRKETLFMSCSWVSVCELLWSAGV